MFDNCGAYLSTNSDFGDRNKISQHGVYIYIYISLSLRHTDVVFAILRLFNTIHSLFYTRQYQLGGPKLFPSSSMHLNSFIRYYTGPYPACVHDILMIFPLYSISKKEELFIDIAIHIPSCTPIGKGVR